MEQTVSGVRFFEGQVRTTCRVGGETCVSPPQRKTHTHNALLHVMNDHHNGGNRNSYKCVISNNVPYRGTVSREGTNVFQGSFFVTTSN